MMMRVLLYLSLFFGVYFTSSLTSSEAHPLKDEIISEHRDSSTYRHLQDLLPQARKEVEARLGLSVPPIQIYLTRDTKEMHALASSHHQAVPPSWSGGLAFARTRQVYLPLQSQQALKPLLHHELAHIALGAHTEPHRLPLWVNEGVAVAIGEKLSAERMRVLNEAAALHALIPFHELTRSFPKYGRPAQIAYAQSGHFISYLRQRVGRLSFKRWLSAVSQGMSPQEAVRTHLEGDWNFYERDWRSTLPSGSLAWLSVLSQSEVLWGVTWIFFLFAGMLRLKRRRRQGALNDRIESEVRSTPQIKTARPR